MPPVFSTIGQCKDFLPTVDSAKRPWPTNDARHRGGDLPGRTARGPVALRKMACWYRPRRSHLDAVQGHRLALEGQRPCCPISNRERKWTPRSATVLCLRLCRSFAQALLGLWITLFSALSFLCSCSCDCQRSRESLALTFTKPLRCNVSRCPWRGRWRDQWRFKWRNSATCPGPAPSQILGRSAGEKLG
jgi:hypothetical protein